MNWLILILAGLFEVGFTTCLNKAKVTTGNTSTFWMIGFFVSLTLSMWLLYKATQTLPLGTAYAVWTGIGAVGTVIVGMLFFNEPTDFWRLFFIFTLIASVVGLKFVLEPVAISAPAPMPVKLRAPRPEADKAPLAGSASAAARILVKMRRMSYPGHCADATRGVLPIQE